MSTHTDTAATKPVVLITGALTGIGRATAFAFAQQGARLIVSGRRDEAGRALAAELRALGGEAEFIHADVSREDDVRAMVDGAVARFGRLDVAVNNAGTEGQFGPITEQTVANYEATFSTNVLGVLLSMKHELRVMSAQGSGAVVNISSVVGQMAVPGLSVYTASKFAVQGLTRTAALEFAATGIRINAVAPGPIATPMLDRVVGVDTPERDGFISMVPAKRAGTAEEVAAAVLYLANPASAYITGHTLAVDGGMLAA